MKETTTQQDNLESGVLSQLAVADYPEGVAKTVNMTEAKYNLSKLALEVEAGGEVIIARGGRPVMRLVPLDQIEQNTLSTKLSGVQLGCGIKYAPDFTWEEWEEADKELQEIWRRFGYMN